MGTHSAIGNRFGEEVRRLRFEHGWSQEHLAEVANLHRNSVGAIERGEMSPTLDVIEAIALALDLLPHQLIRKAEK